MTTCAKCNLAIESEGGYAKCVGCNKRYHFGQCSVSSTTWRAKGQPQKDEWRCKSCNQASKGSKLDDVTPEILSETPSDVLKSIHDSLRQFGLQQDEKFKNLHSDLKSHSTVLFTNLEKLINVLITELQVVKSEVKTMAAQQISLTEEKDVLKNDLNNAKKRIADWELKMSQATKSDTLTPPTYSKTLQSESRYQQNVNINDTPGEKSRVSRPHTTTTVRSNGNVPVTNGVQSQSYPAARMSNSARSPLVAGRGAPLISSAPGGDENGWNTVNHRKKRTDAKIGKKSLDQANGSQSNLMAAPRIQTSAMFVSRFAPSVSSQVIADMVRSSVQELTELKVTKIKSRYMDKYTSFHVEVLSSEFEKIDDVNIWPDGCLIKQFNGKLISEIIVNED